MYEAQCQGTYTILERTLTDCKVDSNIYSGAVYVGLEFKHDQDYG